METAANQARRLAIFQLGAPAPICHPSHVTRLIQILIALLVTHTLVLAEYLTEAERKELMESLSKIQSDANSRVDERYRVAIRAYKAAMGSNEAALDLYLRCIEKVRFEDRYKDNRDFREWRDKNEESFSEPSFKYALRQQLRWLVLTLKANSQDPDRKALASEAASILDSIFADITNLNDQKSVLSQSVLGSVFAKAYEVKATKNEWPASPIAIAEIYEQVILPELRSPTKLKSLKSAWIRRIKLEEIDALEWLNTRTDFRTNGRRDSKREREAKDDLRDERQINEEKFQLETYPKLIWMMEVDLFKSGDEAGSAGRMLAHIQKYLNHSSATEWAEELKSLLDPEAEPPEETATP